jgi:hypothetical protein
VNKMKALRDPRSVTLNQLPGVPTDLASYSFSYDHFSPAIGRESGSKGWYIRLIVGQSWNGASVRTSWEYFKTDDNGLIVESPWGMAKQFNGRCKLSVEELENATKEYAEKRVNQ